MIKFLKDLHKKTADAFFVMLSLSGFWFWLHIFIFNFDTSPLNDLLYKTGADSGVAQLIAFIAIAAGVCVQVFIFDESARNKTSPWFSFAWIVSTVLVGLVADKTVYYAMLAVMGIFAGFVLARLMLLLIFLLPRQNSSRYIIVQFTLTNIPFMILRAQLLGHITWLNYLIVVAIQVVSAFALYKAKPDILKIRAQIPDKKISFGEILPVIAMVAGIYFCMGGIQAVARPNFADTPNIYLFQIIPNVVTIILYFLWIYKIQLITNMTIFFVLLGLAFATFQMSGGSVSGRYVFETFMESANYFIDVFEFVFFARLIYAFGRRSFRVKVMLATVTLIIGGAYAIAAIFWDTVLSPGLYASFYIAIVLLLAAVPYLTKKLPFLFDEDYRVKVDTSVQALYEYETLAIAASGEERLNEQELKVLFFICQRQDYDVTANLLSLSKKELHESLDSIFTKLGVKNRSELFARLGVKNRGKLSTELDRFEKFGLTNREKELAGLLLTGEAQKNIAYKMGISYSTVRFHSNNLYRKLNIQSRAELFSLFMQPPPGEATANSEYGLPAQLEEE